MPKCLASLTPAPSHRVLPGDQLDSDLGIPDNVLERHCTIRPPRVPHARTCNWWFCFVDLVEVGVSCVGGFSFLGLHHRKLTF